MVRSSLFALLMVLAVVSANGQEQSRPAFKLPATVSTPMIAGSAAANASLDWARAYMNAWSFRDYGTMYKLSSAGTRKRLTVEQFAAAVSRLTAPASDPTTRASFTGVDGLTVYFEYQAGTATGRTSLLVRPDGIEHPEIVLMNVPALTPVPAPTGVRITDAQQASAPAPQAPQAPGSGGIGQQTAMATAPAGGETIDWVLNQMIRAGKNVQSIRGTITMKGSLLGQTVSEQGTVAFKVPGKFHVRTNSFVVNCDGTKGMLYIPDTKTVVDLGAIGAIDFAPGFDSPNDLKQSFAMRLIGRSTVNNEPAYDIELNPKLPIPSSMGSTKMRLQVSGKTWMPIKADMGAMSVEYSNLQINPPDITDATFNYRPPAGTTTLSASAILGSLGDAGLPQF